MIVHDTDPDVARVFSAMLDDTAEPPLPTAAQAVSAARRRSLAATGTAVGAGTAVLAVAGVAVLAATAAPGPAPAPPAVAAPATSPAPVRLEVAPLLRAPTVDQAHQQGKRNAEILAAAVGPGLAISVLQLSKDDSPAATWRVEHSDEYVSTVELAVTDGHGTGMLGASIHGGLTGVGTDPCGAAVKTMMNLPVCTVRTVGGVQVGVGTADDANLGRTVTAVRLLDGGILSIEAAVRIAGYDGSGPLPLDAKPGASTGTGGLPALAAPPLDEQRAADLVVNPQLLPS